LFGLGEAVKVVQDDGRVRDLKPEDKGIPPPSPPDKRKDPPDSSLNGDKKDKKEKRGNK